MGALVLGVDDSLSVRKMVEFALKSKGFDVRTVCDGREALDALARAKYSLIVLDVNMPRMDGLALLKEARTHKEWDDIKILMLTTEGQESDRDRALALGASDYMVKPFKPSELVARVEAMLAGQA